MLLKFNPFEIIAFFFCLITLSSYSLTLILSAIKRISKFVHEWKRGDFYAD